MLVRETVLLDRKRFGLGKEEMARLFRENGTQYELEHAIGQGQYKAYYIVRAHIEGVTLRDVLAGRPGKPGRRFLFLEVIKILVSCSPG
jgi:hypothetical protein